VLDQAGMHNLARVMVLWNSNQNLESGTLFTWIEQGIPRWVICEYVYKQVAVLVGPVEISSILGKAQ